MAIGFMRSGDSTRFRDCKWLGVTLLALLHAAPGAARAADVSVIGVFPGRGAVLVVDALGPQSVRVGQSLGGVTVISADKNGALIEEAGHRRTVHLGQHVVGATPENPTARVTLRADENGHFVADASVNGTPIRFLVDTGATVVAIPGREAREMGIDFTKGVKAMVTTANGRALVYQIKLDRIKIGAIELQNVDAMVLDGGGLTQPLLGMSVLNRLEMRREGDSMTLRRRF